MTKLFILSYIKRIFEFKFEQNFGKSTLRPFIIVISMSEEHSLNQVKFGHES